MGAVSIDAFTFKTGCSVEAFDPIQEGGRYMNTEANKRAFPSCTYCHVVKSPQLKCGRIMAGPFGPSKKMVKRVNAFSPGYCGTVAFGPQGPKTQSLLLLGGSFQFGGSQSFLGFVEVLASFQTRAIRSCVVIGGSQMPMSLMFRRRRAEARQDCLTASRLHFCEQ